MELSNTVVLPLDQDDETMLMRSPVHPSLMRWVLRPAPAGRRRLAVAYLTAAAGLVAGLLILAITVIVARQCQVGAAAGFACMSPFFRGIWLALLGFLVVALGLSIFTKLGIRFMAALVAVTAPVLLISELLSIWGAEPRPYALIALIGVPAAASWLSARMLRGGPDDPESADPGRQTDAVTSRRSNFGRTHHFGQVFLR